MQVKSYLREISETINKLRKIEKERVPHVKSFTLYYLWQYRKPACDMHLV